MEGVLVVAEEILVFLKNIQGNVEEIFGVLVENLEVPCLRSGSEDS